MRMNSVASGASRPALRAVCVLAALAISGCTVGPRYERPTADVPANFKEAGEWKAAQPSDESTKGSWWKVYQDPQLNALEDQISVSNQTLKISQAQFAEARAAVKISRAGYFPSVTGNISAAHYSGAPNAPLASGKTSYQDYVIPVDVSYEPDVWGRVRRTVEAARSEAQASAADLANVELSIRAELAFDYFSLRGLDAEKALLDSTVISYQKALDLTTTRYQGGLASAVDVAQAETQLETTRAQSIDVGVARAAFEHAIAVLTGKPAANFSLPPMPLATPPPGIPPGLPSELLERRPDIAAAERRVQEANAQIGVAKAAYFPLVTLTGSGGLESAAISTLIQGPSAFWTLGGAAAETIIEGGARRGTLNQAYAQRDQAIATYQQTVLTAFQEVEDNLAALRILQEEAQTEDAAVAAAQHSLSLSITRYKGGIANYIEVTIAQSAKLADEVTAVSILTRRMTSSVQLIKALGGGWNLSQIPRV